METKHTPTPWHNENGAILDTNNNLIADTSDGRDKHGLLLPSDIRMNNAALIERAVNSHAELVAALENIAAQPMSNDWARETARAALARARK
jgi:hypothetical protein